MKKIKNFADFINENKLEDWERHQKLDNGEYNITEPIEDWERHQKLDNGEYDEITDLEDTKEFKSEIEADVEDEEIDDLLELIYNQRTESWEDIGELDLPTDFESFQEWFMDEIGDDDTTTASMKEEGEEVVFHIPEDLYVKYLELEKGRKDELDDITQRDDFDENEFDDEENLPLDFKGTFRDNRFNGINPEGEFPKDFDDE